MSVVTFGDVRHFVVEDDDAVHEDDIDVSCIGNTEPTTTDQSQRFSRSASLERRGSLATLAVLQRKKNDDFLQRAAADTERLALDGQDMADMLERRGSLNQNSYFNLKYWSDELERVWSKTPDGVCRRSSILEQKAARDREHAMNVQATTPVADYALYSHPLIGRRLRRPGTTSSRVAKTIGEYRPGTYKNYLACHGMETVPTPTKLLSRPSSAPLSYHGLAIASLTPPTQHGVRHVSATASKHATPRSRPTSAALASAEANSATMMSHGIAEMSPSRSRLGLADGSSRTLVPPLLMDGRVNYQQMFEEQKEMLQASDVHRRDVYEKTLSRLEEHNTSVQRRFSEYLGQLDAIHTVH